MMMSDEMTEQQSVVKIIDSEVGDEVSVPRFYVVELADGTRHGVDITVAADGVLITRFYGSPTQPADGSPPRLASDRRIAEEIGEYVADLFDLA
jgi:hypothetical protein